MQSCAFGHTQILPRMHSSFARRPLRLASRCTPSVGVRCATGDVMLEVKGLEARVASTGEHILRGVNLTVREGEIHAIMGTNGSGKSTFSKVLVGHPEYEVTGGTGMTSKPPEHNAQNCKCAILHIPFCNIAHSLCCILTPIGSSQVPVFMPLLFYSS